MRISDWSSDVCSSDLVRLPLRNERYHSAFLRGLRRKIGEAGDKGPDTLLIDRLAPAGAVFRIFFGTALFVAERLRNHDPVVGVAQSRVADSQQHDRLLAVREDFPDRTSVVSGKRVRVSFELGGCLCFKKKT